MMCQLDPRHVIAKCVGLWMILLAGCGIQGPPLPPLRLTPQPLSDFTVAQHGKRVEVSYTVPSASVDGKRLPVVVVEIFWATQEGDLQQSGRRRERKAAPGERLVDLLTPLPPPGTTLFVSGCVNVTRRVSTMAPTVMLTIQPPPPVPTDLQVERTQNGVSVSWKAVAIDCPAPDGVATPEKATCLPIAGYHVYRRAENVKKPRKISPTPLVKPRIEDRDMARDTRQCYSVTSLISTDPLIESLPSAERCLAVSPEAQGEISSSEESGAITEPRATPFSSPE